MSQPALMGDEGAAVVHDIRRLRRDAERSYAEVDLVIAALRDNLRDLRIERDRLEREVARLQDDIRRATTPWLGRGAKPNR